MTIYLEANQVPQSLRGSYTGKRFKAEIRESVIIPIDAGLWSGGSRDVYYGVKLSTGEQVKFPGQDSSPFSGERRENRVTLEPGLAVIRHTTFQGKDLGLTFYMHASDVAPLIGSDDKPTLSEAQHYVLAASQGLIASARREYAQRERGLNTKAYDECQAQLVELGLMKANGAITIEGKNLLTTLPRIL